MMSQPQLKRARAEELQQKINVRKRFERDYNRMVDTGVSFNFSRTHQEPLELESFITKQNIDAQLQSLLVNQFINSLDITLKERLLERFPIFKKTFEENFTMPTPQTLQANHSMFTMNIFKKEQGF